MLHLERELDGEELFLCALLQDLSAWMAGKGYASLADVRGIMRVPAAADASAYERAGYVSMVRPAVERPQA